ncbi:GtrA family protein [Pseudoxanthomonas wuyuanensis]|uniref:Flippase GtrA (Transmembrane translocase of bactoprenol-linked glucose) n=1 Tax=Pseudoxanthomonas wuyuanensis TaxID=1073196 RepID=A0A286DAD6_9GAMM|nr:GtrA family protein [Pseudoxanthomonas wuyuanensis]KAF1720557.1 GtrA family protein [Pseudoxanthomonas wuyuanensis]SOD55610.1 Putative flippase GtrA (transmembrane translocase of bactoprenol-linked glucose) [Pseudoxanthomonas wuyuanensis]
MLSRQFFLFLLAGGIAALANFGSRIALGLVMAYVPAIVLAYCIGMLTAFLLNRAFVFANPGTRLHHQALWFIAINLAALLQTLAVSLLFARWAFPAIGMAFHPETVAHAIGVAVPVVTSYVGHKRLTFRTTRHRE